MLSAYFCKNYPGEGDIVGILYLFCTIDKNIRLNY